MYQTPYQQPLSSLPPPTPLNRGTSGGSIPYQYGQLPSTSNPSDPKSQHPIPGSFNRHAFNPATQSFVPGNVGPPVPQTMSHHGSPHMSYNNSYNASQQQQQQFNNGTGYGMVRQGSNNSVPSYHASPHMAHRSMMPQGMQQGLGLGYGLTSGMGMQQQNMPQHMPPGMNQGPSQSMQGMGHNNSGNGLPNYGNPATLPPKPPTGI